MRNEYEKTVLRLLAGRDFIATEEVAGLIGASPATARRLINRLAENPAFCGGCTAESGRCRPNRTRRFRSDCGNSGSAKRSACSRRRR